ncbi:SsrA-binding protein SmpB [Pseudobdellovibrio exovorus]|uniref:SsrA-binding protein n=1 Tax=Pseudobdellovibrio exovorus JSS TaxID=1184267 RepID=M4VCR4_9BACT|nr:SsrA-binding protein SmpB [Pseudobdellovibrio exovorus]AGH96280.1 SsrA-binding protein [Pseudobdellovibrio exovorus JSS]
MSILIIQENRSVRHDYHIIETFEAGLVLTGSEVKSIRAHSVQLKDSYISFKGHEAFLQNAHISEYKASSYNNHHPERLRKILLHKSELDKIYGSLREKGLTCVATKIYFKKGRVKVEIALVKGKKLHDKREAIKKRDVDTHLRRVKQVSK